MTDRDFCKLFQRIEIRNAAGRVSRRIDDECFCAVGDRRFKGSLVKLEARACIHGHENGVCVADERLPRIVCPTGVAQNDLVARIEDRQHGQHERFHAARGHDDLGFRVIAEAVGSRHGIGNSFAQRQNAGVGRVVMLAAAQRVNGGLNDVRRRRKIRFADSEADDVRHAERPVEHLTDRGVCDGFCNV